MDRAAPLSHDALGPTLCIGEILVEIMAKSIGNGFREPIDLIGPFASGAPAIFIDGEDARTAGREEASPSKRQRHY